MLETVANILLVVLGISLLIFLHELGHFLAARMFKVRVETFSIGFGPRIAGTRRGDTDYRISAIPLGGYVKMAGEYGDYPDDDERELDPDDLMAKPIWQRFIIFSAGVIANFLFAFIAYPLAYGSGALVHAPVAGDVAVAGPAWAAGIRSGDEFLSVNGQRVYSFEDVVLEMALSDPEGTTARIRRDGVELDVDIVPVRSADGSRYEIAAEPLLENSLIVAKGSPAAAAGLKTGDRIVRAGDDWVVGDIWNGGPLSAKRALTLAAPNGGRLSVQVERDGELIDATVEPAPTERLMLGAGAVRTRVLALRGAADRPDFPLQPDQAIVDDTLVDVPSIRAAAEAALAGDGRLTVDVRGDDGVEAVVLTKPDLERILAGDVAFGDDVSSPRIRAVPGGALALAGLQDGDTILSLNDATLASFSDLLDTVQSDPDQVDYYVRYARDGTEHEVSVRARPAPGDSGIRFPLAQVSHDLTFSETLDAGFSECINALRRTGLTLVKLFTAEVGANNLGGPVSIAHITYEVAKRDLGSLLLLLAFLSVNLGFINILPIPVLDGGQIMFLLCEKIKGSRLSVRSMQNAQLVGLVAILALMVYVTWNDLDRLL